MNERIKQLAEQCTVSCIDGRGVELNEIDVEQFAELIVKECMNCATWVGKVNKHPGEPIRIAYAINLRIKEHFGVEE